MEVWIDGQTFVFTNQIRNSSALRKSFNALTKETFGFDFVSYYEDGFWGDGYLPHVLIDRGRVVSNVSVNLMPISILGEERFYVQLGTVMTAKEYRNRGLARFLME